MSEHNSEGTKDGGMTNIIALAITGCIWCMMLSLIFAEVKTLVM